MASHYACVQQIGNSAETQEAKLEKHGNCPDLVALLITVLGCMEYTHRLIVHGDRDAIEQ